MTTIATLPPFDQALADFQAKLAELAFAKATQAEISQQLTALTNALDPAVSADAVWGKLILNDVNAFQGAQGGDTLAAVIDRLGISDAARFVNSIQNQVIGAPTTGFNTYASFIFAGSEFQVERITNETHTQAVTEVFTAGQILGSVIGLATGGLGLASAVDKYLQLQGTGASADALTEARIDIANNSLGIGGNITSIIQGAIVLGYSYLDESSNATAAFGYGLIPSLSSASEGASLLSVAVGSLTTVGTTAIALAQIGFASYNFANLVKGWQAADADGTPVSAEEKAIASTSYALNTLAGVVGAVGGLLSLAFPPAGVIIGIVGAVISAVAFFFDWFTSLLNPLQDHLYLGTDGNDTILPVTLSSLQVEALAGDDYIKPVPVAKGTLPFSANDSNNFVDGGAGKDTLDVSGATDYLAAVAAYRPVNTVSLGSNGYWSVDRFSDVSGGNFLMQHVARVINVENVFGSNGQDSLTGDGGDNILVGRQGNDTVLGGDGNDLLSGGLGNDLLDGGADVDTVNYRYDTDEAAGKNGSGLVIDLQSGHAINIIDGSLADTLRNIENAVGSNASDYLSGSNGANVLLGARGNDEIYGLGGNDTLSGGLGADTLNGEGGTDTVDYHLDKDEADGYLGQGYLIDLNRGTARTLVQEIEVVTGYEYRAVNGRLAYVPIYGRQAAVIAGDTLASIENAIGSNASDSIIGSDTENFLAGGKGNDTINGGKGSDSLSGGAGNDSLDGGEGIDTLFLAADQDDSGRGFGVDLAAGTVSRSADFFVPGAFEDRIANIENIVGGDYDDYLYGDANANVIAGSGGFDNVDGRAGNDTLLGGDGNDILYGGADADLLSGGAGYDTLYGGNGTDTLSLSIDARDIASGWRINLNDGPRVFAYRLSSGDINGASAYEDRLESIENIVGGNGNDWFTGNDVNNALFGQAGDDRLDGNGGNDTLDGGAGNDSISGGIGHDVILGRTGNDTVDGGEGNDTILGGAGNNSITGGADDDILSGGWGNDTIDGGTGRDTVSYQIDAQEGNYRSVNVDLTSGFVTITDQSATYVNADTLMSIENVIATNGNDTITGNDAANALFGLDGADNLDGGVGNDTLIGGKGDDRLSGGTGDDLLSGGLGNDTLEGGAENDTLAYSLDADEAGYISIDADLAAGTVLVSRGGAANETDRLSEIENISATNGNDTLRGDAQSNRLLGLDGNDLIEGRAGGDVLLGGNGNDSVDGGIGNDFLSGGTGNDTLNGGADSDTALFNEDNSRWSINLATGIAARAAAGGALVNEDTLVGIENLITGAGNDSITGSDLANQISAGAGNDTIDGGVGNDQISGEEGNDYIRGGAGDDLIVGGAGSDTIDGGADTDTLAFSEGLSSGLFAAYGAALAGFDVTIGQTVTVKALSTTGAVLETDTATNIEAILASDRAETVRVTAAVVFNTDARGGIDTLDLSGVAAGTAIYANLSTGAVKLIQANSSVQQTHLNYENLNGTGESDVLIGSDLVNTIHAGAGNDLLIGLSGGDQLDGGTGSDTASYASSLGAVQVNLATGTATGGDAQGDVLTSIENLEGSRFADMLTGDAGANVIDGGSGNDLLTGGIGADTFVFTKGSGADIIQDFAAEDVIHLSGFSGVGSFQNLLNIASQVGYDVILQLNANDQIVLKNQTVAHLQADDFLFA